MGTITRKQFLKASVTAAIGGVTLYAVGCGDEDDPTNPTTVTSANTGPTGPVTAGGGTTMQSSSAGPMGCSANIVGNHGHSLSIPAADVTAAMDTDYNIQGGSGHSHTVSVTAADFGTLGGGGAVTITSSMGNMHTHDVTISNC